MALTTHSAFLDLSTFVNELGYACSSEEQPLRVGIALETHVPFNMTVERIYASLNTLPVGNPVSIDVNIGGSTMLNNNISIPTTASFSETSLFLNGQTTFDIAKDDELSFEIDSVDTGAATGLKVYLIGHRGS